MVFKLKLMDINKRHSKLKVGYFKMPNASYTHRYAQAKKTKRKMTNSLQENKEVECHTQIAHP